MRSYQRLTVLLALSLLLAGCGSVTVRTSATPTAARIGTPTASPTPRPTKAISSTISTVSFDQFRAACAGADAQGSAYRIGDLYVVVALTNVSYPAAKLPDGVALK